MDKKEKRSWLITTIALILISTAGASFNNIVEVFIENIIKSIIPSLSEIAYHFIVFLVFLLILTLLGFGFKSIFKKVVSR